MVIRVLLVSLLAFIALCSLLCTGQQIARCMSGHTPANWKTDTEVALEQKSHMNDLPVPEGDWQENYKKRNSKWNIQLVASTGLMLVTAYVVSMFISSEVMTLFLCRHIQFSGSSFLFGFFSFDIISHHPICKQTSKASVDSADLDGVE